jgi:hypothetical protein
MNLRVSIQPGMTSLILKVMGCPVRSKLPVGKNSGRDFSLPEKLLLSTYYYVKQEPPL